MRSWTILAWALAVCASVDAGAAVVADPPREGDVVLRSFHFAAGDSLPALRLHYLTLGRARRDGAGEITNAIMVLHGTGGSGRQFLVPQFAGPLYGAGCPLDTTRWFIVLADGIGHGASSKPSDGLRARFPRYGYGDMVRAQHDLLLALGVRHLRLLMGTSMGGMQTWLWGERYPDLMDALMPLACQPVAIAGRNRAWRQMIVQAIRLDPEWRGGDYVAEPRQALRTAADLLFIAGSAPIALQLAYPTGDSANRYVDAAVESRMATLDANDLLYQIEASRDYDPSAELERIVAPLVMVNSGDDFINPPELGIAERMMPRVKRGRFVLLPASERTHGHGTHTWAALWKDELETLLADSARGAGR
jgi:homoserine O-acetyltransferase